MVCSHQGRIWDMYAHGIGSESKKETSETEDLFMYIWVLITAVIT